MFSGAANFTGFGSTTFNGGYSPGDSPALVTHQGDVFLGATNELMMELGGLEAGDEFDKLMVQGDLWLGGSLSIDLIDGFELGLNQVFDIIAVRGNLSGSFFGLNEGSLLGNFAGVDLFITYDPVTLFGAASGGVSLYSIPEPSALAMAVAVLALGLAAYRKKRE